jgi:Ribosomal protein S36, mitochondrial
VTKKKQYKHAITLAIIPKHLPLHFRRLNIPSPPTMQRTAITRASQVHKPLINFIGKRKWGSSSHYLCIRSAYDAGVVEPAGPRPHPQAPNDTLPSPVSDFKRYRANAQQHGPLAKAMHSGAGQNAARQVSASDSGNGNAVLDRNELPSRFRRLVMTSAEIEAIEVYCYDVTS